MSKLDWSRASERSPDPARYQRQNDFLSPDETVYSGGPKPSRRSPAQLQARAARKAQKKALKDKERHAKEAAKALKIKRQGENATAKAKQVAKAKEYHCARAEARRVAFEDYKKTTKYAAEQAKEAARIAAKKKSHLQFWVENEIGLSADRDVLRKRWRDGLLKRSEARGMIPPLS